MKYNPREIEEKWQKIWEERPGFKADDFSKKEKFYALVEFPYPSGLGLHVGHAFTFNMMDIFARKKRMEGKNVLYPMGWDAFGLPTENYAVKTGIHPARATRNNTDTFRNQMKYLGFAYNWDREINTTSSSYYKWTQWIFQQLFKYGLAYKKEMDINWCPSCRIGLANEEVVNGNCERCGAKVSKRKLSQWLLRITAYADRLTDELDMVDFPESVVASQRNWIGRSTGMTIDFPLSGSQEKISVFTTRSDTLFGVSFFVLAPEHPLAIKITTQENKKAVEEYIQEAKNKMEFERIAEVKEKTGVFTGSYVKNPLSKEDIPVYVADFVVISYGTGAVMGVPAHDQRDWEFAKAHNIKIKEVIAGGNIGKEAYTGAGLLINSGKYNGLPFQEAKEKIYQDLKEMGLAKKETQYHIRDWIFSRQHYWGEPIPMVYCPACAEKGIAWWQTEDGKIFLGKHGKEPLVSNIKKNSQGLAGWFPISEKELPLKLPDVEKYEPTGTGESPLTAIKSWTVVKCPFCGGEAKRETDTMPNWAGSSWYYLRYCDPSNPSGLADRNKLDYWLPVDIYLGGAEHTTLHLLYSRFWHKFLDDIGLVPNKEPYQKRRVHGVILGEDGSRMSKSKENVINPEAMAQEFGVDALRTYLAFIGPYNGVFPWSTDGIKGTRKFLDRFFDFAQNQIQKKSDKTEEKIKILLNRLIFEVGRDIDNFKFNTGVAKLMKFLNQAKNKELSSDDLKNLLLILSPFAPFVTEELWQKMGGNGSIHQQPWPDYDVALIKSQEVTFIIQINGRIRDKIIVKSGITEHEAKELSMGLKKIKKWIKGKEIKKTFFVPDRLINITIE